MKRDVLTLQLSSAVTIQNIAGGNPPSWAFPAISVVPLCTGAGPSQDYSTAPAAPTGTPLQTEGIRGASVRAIQFDLLGSVSCWLQQTGTPTPFVFNDAVTVYHYMAIVKGEFDRAQYDFDGSVVPGWARPPDLLLSARDQSLSGPTEPFFDPEVEVFWRGLDFAIAQNCLTCFPCANYSGCPDPDLPHAEGCSLGMGGTQIVSGTVNQPNRAYAFMNHSRYANIRHVKLRTGRFLKENEALFWVENFVSPDLPVGAEVIWLNQLFGSAAIKVAR